LRTYRLLTHAIVVVLAVLLSGYSTLGKGLPASLRLGLSNRGALTALQGGTVGTVELGRQGTVVKPLAIPAAAAIPHKAFRYVVASGDDIKAVAARFGLQPDDVCGSNPGLATGPRLQAGDALMLPPVHGIVVAVKAGETLERLASTYQVGLTEIMDFNYLRNPSDVREGLQLVLPSGRGMRCPGTTSRTGPGLEALALGPPGCPIRGAVETQPFGPSTFEGFHSGIDLANISGTPILAAAAGTATVNKGGTGYGNNVMVRVSADRVDLYAHMSVINVAPGQAVQVGQMIGREGSTGFSTGPHLHWEVRIHGTPIDPAPFLRC
jgi:murein DD-endopeptidase MepM/ murein hydrolase activator NlpD